MNFILSYKRDINIQGKHTRFSDFCSVNFVLNNQIKEREFFFEDKNIYILADANISFINTIKDIELTVNNIEKKIDLLNNGFVIVFDKSIQSVFVFTDIFGFYQLFLLENEKGTLISNDFNNLIPFSEKSLNDYAILDMILFNYTLLERTILSDIVRIGGGFKIELSSLKISRNRISNFIENITIPSSHDKIGYKKFSDLLVKSIQSEVSKDYKTFLTMTAGFDSRALLASCNKLNLPVWTITFGQEGNIEHEIIKEFIHDFSQGHKLYALDENYIDNIYSLLLNYISDNLDNPIILDLPHYKYIMTKMDSSNLLAGFMGGEMLSGQTVGAQVTFTKFASQILMSNNYLEMHPIFIDFIRRIKFLNHDYIEKIALDYLQSLSVYSLKPGRVNVLNFLINEKYVKFFGAVNKVSKNQSNLIIPFMNNDFLTFVLNSDFCFLNKGMFSKNPLWNIKRKIFYSKAIKFLCPLLSETRFDRLYKVNDLCNPIRLPIAGYYYFINHIFNKNKKMYPRPHYYDLWYKKMVVNEFNGDDFKINSRIFNEKVEISKENYDQSNAIDKKIFANILGLSIAYEMIRNRK